MAIHRIELRLKGLAAVGFTYFGRADAWALFDTVGTDMCAGFGLDPPWRDEEFEGCLSPRLHRLESD